MASERRLPVVWSGATEIVVGLHFNPELGCPMDLAVLSDETLLRYYEDIRVHLSIDIRSGGHRFLGQAAKERANLLLMEIHRRQLSVTPIYWPE
jgi:hypothetical protein